MNADGTAQQRLTYNNARDMEPAWSATRPKIAFTSHRDGNAEIYTMNPDGTDQMNLTNDEPY
jgi:TolB protein